MIGFDFSTKEIDFPLSTLPCRDSNHKVKLAMQNIGFLNHLNWIKDYGSGPYIGPTQKNFSHVSNMRLTKE